jgi:hypothetical protein
VGSGVEIVLECSGKFLTPEELEPYFHRAVRKVVVAAPVKHGALNVVMGVQGWLFWLSFSVSVIAITVYLLRHDPSGTSYAGGTTR